MGNKRSKQKKTKQNPKKNTGQKGGSVGIDEAASSSHNKKSKGKR